MRSRFAVSFALCFGFAAAALAADEAVVVSVGETKLSAGELGRRLSRVPDFQLARHGSSPESARKAWVEEVVVPELLLASEAKQRKLDQTPALQGRVRDLLREAMERALREELATAPVTDAEIKAYFEENRGRFETPKRVRIWRILVADEARAKEIITQAKGSDGPKRWGQLARDHSTDKATSLRNGDLGFVRPDGSTDVPRVKVSAEIVAAAQKLADGALLEQPVREGEQFAVVWRRGSMPEVKRTLAQEEPSIRKLLERRRSEQARKELLERLKKQALGEVHPELLEHIDTAAFGAPPKRSPKRDGGKLDKAGARPKEKPAR
jgi:peptidyl-prolyl cis-trans isomerase C